MSCVRVGRPQQHNKVKKAARPKKAAGAKREWVSTVNDLTVHKPTPAELNHRHEMHKSHNKAAAQWELKEKALKRRLRYAGSPAPLDKASLSIIREVFSDQLLLQDVVARSDRALAVVKDLFGDAPRRQTGHPSVTMAPNCDSDSDLPVLQRPDPPTQLSLLSQSMMDQEALNELHPSEEDFSDEDPDCHVVRRANVRKTKSRGRVIQQQKAKRHISDLGHGDKVPVTPCASGAAPDQKALNATVAVKRLQGRAHGVPQTKEVEPSILVSQVLNPGLHYRNSRTEATKICSSQSSELNGSSVASMSGDHPGRPQSLGFLQSMLSQVEADLDSMRTDAEPESAAQKSPNQPRTHGLTGFSVALISTIGRLVDKLKQMDENVHKEAEGRRKLEEELREQRGLIDALTAESMSLREVTAALQAGLQQRTTEVEQKLDSVVLLMGGLGLLDPHTDTPPHGPSGKTAVCLSAPADAQVPEQIPASVSPAFLFSAPQQRDTWPVCRSAPADAQVPERIPASVSPAFLFSPPQQRDSVGSRTQFSASSFPSFASTSPLSLLSPDPTLSQRSAAVVLAEIAELSRQNELIRAHLDQAKVLCSAGSPDSGSGGEQRRQSSRSSGRTTPQSVGERRSSGSSGSCRRNANIQVTEGPQTTSSNPSVSSVEQRLLELNRQSAAARGRLLELIEQQKNTLSNRASPSSSPIPMSALSPQTTGGGGGRPQVTESDRESLSQAGSGGCKW